MGVSFLQPWWWLLLPGVLLVAWYWRRPWLALARQSGPAALARERRRLWARCLLLTLLVAALAGPRLVSTVQRQAVLFVLDASDSVGPALADGEDWVRRALNGKAPSDLAGVVTAGSRALVEEPPDTAPVFHRVQTDPGTEASDLPAALRLAGSLLPADARRRVVLLSDGRDTSGEALAAARELRQEGVRLDVVPLGRPAGPDLRLESVTLPAQAFAGESAALQVRISADRPAAAVLRIERDGRLLGQSAVSLQAGDNRFSFAVAVGEAGLHRYRVSVEADPAVDHVQANNGGGAVQRVLGPPTVLVVASAPQEAAALVRALRARGEVEVRLAGPADLPNDPAGWAAYRAVFLVNVAAFELGAQAMAQLEAYVRDSGGGLVMTGGSDAFGPGGYAGTAVERALPVEMHLSGRGEQPSLGLMLVIDKSGSMADLKMELAKEAAARAVELLTVRDRVGVIAFDTGAWPVVPLAPVADEEAIKRQIGSIYASGGTEIYPAVAAAYQALKEAPVRIKHIILLTDGVSASGGPYVDLAREMRRAGITLSTVAVGPDADAGMLLALAELGRGRFYATADAANIPSIFTRETVMAARSYAVNERFFPQIAAGGPLLRGLSTVPPLDGYVAVTPKARAEVNLIAPGGDPILAAWQYGLGRAVAWTPDVAGRWSAAWVASPAFPRLWGNVLSWLLGTAAGQMEIRTSLVEGGGGRRARIQVDDPGGWAEVKKLGARVTGPTGESRSLSLAPAGPGRYAAEVPVPETGAYLIGVAEGERLVAQTGFVVPYPEEYRHAGTDLAFLEQVARAGGGEVLAAPEAAFARNLPPVRAGRDFSSLLLALAALLWLADIAGRRLVLGREERAELRRAWHTLVARALGSIRRRLALAGDAAAAARSLETAQRLKAKRLGERLRQAAVPDTISSGATRQDLATAEPPVSRTGTPEGVASATAAGGAGETATPSRTPEPTTTGPAVPPGHAGAPAEPPAAVPETTAARLLAAKRRRRSAGCGGS